MPKYKYGTKPKKNVTYSELYTRSQVFRIDSVLSNEYIYHVALQRTKANKNEKPHQTIQNHLQNKSPTNKCKTHIGATKPTDFRIARKNSINTRLHVRRARASSSDPNTYADINEPTAHRESFITGGGSALFSPRRSR